MEDGRPLIAIGAVAALTYQVTMMMSQYRSGQRQYGGHGVQMSSGQALHGLVIQSIRGTQEMVPGGVRQGGTEYYNSGALSMCGWLSGKKYGDARDGEKEDRGQVWG